VELGFEVLHDAVRSDEDCKHDIKVLLLNDEILVGHSIFLVLELIEACYRRIAIRQIDNYCFLNTRTREVWKDDNALPKLKSVADTVDIV
jgi:hypothetical protein